MDIAYYLSELLEQLGEVNVPGLGSFTRVKVDGYYNSDEGRFYPPASKIEFNQHYIDDDVLARYIGVKKRISLASSKYFTEKYLNGLRQEIMSKAITLADIGLLYFENGAIRFKAAEAMPDPAFFGYPQIVLNKLGNEPLITDTIPVAAPEREPEPEVEEEIEQRKVEEYVAPVIHHEPQAEETHEGVVEEETISHFEENAGTPEGYGIDEAIIAEETITRTEEHEALHDGGQEGNGIDEQQGHFAPEVVENGTHTGEDDDFIFHSVTHEELEEEEEPGRGYKWLWITLIIIAVAGGGVFGWFYYQQMQQPTVVKKIAPVTEKDTIDTLKNAAAADTNKKAVVTPAAQNTPASTIDSTKRRYEIIGVKVATLKEAKKIISNYEGIHINAHLLEHKDIPGPLYKISLGTYLTNKQALVARDSLLKTKKVRKDIEIRTINPKK